MTVDLDAPYEFWGPRKLSDIVSPVLDGISYTHVWALNLGVESNDYVTNGIVLNGGGGRHFCDAGESEAVKQTLQRIH